MHRPKTTSSISRPGGWSIPSTHNDESQIYTRKKQLRNADDEATSFALPPMQRSVFGDVQCNVIHQGICGVIRPNPIPIAPKVPPHLFSTTNPITHIPDQHKTNSDEVDKTCVNVTLTAPSNPATARVLFATPFDEQTRKVQALQKKTNFFNQALSSKDDKFNAVVRLNAELQAQLNDLLRVNEMLRIDAELQRRENKIHKETETNLTNACQKVEQQSIQIRELEYSTRTLQDENNRLVEENKGLVEEKSKWQTSEEELKSKLSTCEDEIGVLNKELSSLRDRLGIAGAGQGIGLGEGEGEGDDEGEQLDFRDSNLNLVYGNKTAESPFTQKRRLMGHETDRDIGSLKPESVATELRALKQEIQLAQAEAALLKAERDRLAEAHRTCGLNAIELIALKKELADNAQLREIVEELRCIAEEKSEEATKLKKQEQTLENALLSRRKELAEVQSQVASTQLAHNQCEVALEQLKDEHKALVLKYNETQKLMRQTQEELVLERSNLGKQIIDLKNTITTLTSDKRTLESTLKATEEERQTLQSEKIFRRSDDDAKVERMTKMAQQVRAAKDEIEALNTTIQSQKSAIALLERQLEQANSARKRADGEIAVQRMRAEGAEAKLLELNESFEANQLTVTRQMRQIETLQTKNDALTKAHHRKGEEIKLLQSKVETNNGFRAQYEETKQTLDQLLESHETTSQELRTTSRSLAQATDDCRKFQQSASEAISREQSLLERFNALKRTATERADKYEKLKEDYLHCVSDLRASQRSLTLSNLGDVEARQLLASAKVAAEEAIAEVTEVKEREKKLKSKLRNAKLELEEAQYGSARILNILSLLLDAHDTLHRAPEHQIIRKLQSISSKICDETLPLSPPNHLQWKGKLQGFCDTKEAKTNQLNTVEGVKDCWRQQLVRWQQGGMFEPLQNPPTLPPNELCSSINFVTLGGWGPGGPSAGRKYSTKDFDCFPKNVEATSQPVLLRGLILTPTCALASKPFLKSVSETVKEHIEWCLDQVQTKTKLTQGLETALSGYERISRLYAECPKEDWIFQAQDITKELVRTNKALSGLTTISKQGEILRIAGLDEACSALEVLDQTLTNTRSESKSKQVTEAESLLVAQAKARERAGLSSATGKVVNERMSSIEEVVARSFTRDTSPLAPLNLAINEMAITLHRTLKSIATMAQGLKLVNESLIHSVCQLNDSREGAVEIKPQESMEEQSTRLSLRIPPHVVSKTLPRFGQSLEKLETEQPVWHPLTTEIRQLAKFVHDTLGAHARVASSLSSVSETILGAMMDFENGNKMDANTLQNSNDTNNVEMLSQVRSQCIDRLREELFEIASYSRKGVWLSPLVRQIVLLSRRLVESDELIQVNRSIMNKALSVSLDCNAEHTCKENQDKDEIGSEVDQSSEGCHESDDDSESKESEVSEREELKKVDSRSNSISNFSDSISPTSADLKMDESDEAESNGELLNDDRDQEAEDIE